MIVSLKVDIDVNPRWFRSAIACAGVPGKADEAREHLQNVVCAQVETALHESMPIEKLFWDRVRVHGRPVRRVLRRHSVK